MVIRVRVVYLNWDMYMDRQGVEKWLRQREKVQQYVYHVIDAKLHGTGKV